MHRTFYGRNLIALGVWFGRYNEGVLSEKPRSRRSVLMKFRSLLLSLILVVGVSLSSTSFARTDQQTQTPATSQTQQPAQTPVTGQTQQPAATQPSTTQPAETQPTDQKPAATDQTQTQPVADQDQPAATPDKDKDKKDSKDSKKKKQRQERGKGQTQRRQGRRYLRPSEWQHYHQTPVEGRR